MNFPLVTVNILSYNRKDELRNTLQKVFEQDYKNIEVIVVDNASSDGTQKMVKSEFPAVQLIELSENIGIAGWNKGFKIAKGEYVLVLDDDSYPEKGTILKGIKCFKNDSKIAVVGFTVYNSCYNLIENNFEFQKSKGKIIYTIGFIGCGAIVNKKVFCELNGYESSIFLYYNEIEFSIRAREKGYRIVFEPNNKIIHSYSSIMRNAESRSLQIDKRRFEHTFYSYSIFLFLHFNSKVFIKYFLKLLLSKFYVSIKLGYISIYLKATKKNFIKLYAIRKKRKPVSEKIQKMYYYGNFKFNDIYVFYSK